MPVWSTWIGQRPWLREPGRQLVWGWPTPGRGCQALYGERRRAGAWSRRPNGQRGVTASLRLPLQTLTEADLRPSEALA